VEARHEQHARRLLAHVVVNHGVIVSIPRPRSEIRSQDADVALDTSRGTAGGALPWGTPEGHVGGGMAAGTAPEGHRAAQYAVTTFTSSSVISPATIRKERNSTGPSSFPHSAVETRT
jgi:hypothetical protein